MVKAIRFHEFGGPEVLKYEDIDIGDPGPGELRLRHTAIGFNFLDARVREGKYPVLPELPAVPGAEAIGVVEAVGDGREDCYPGDMAGELRAKLDEDAKAVERELAAYLPEPD